MEVVNQESMEGVEEENDSTGEESIEETEENNLETSFTAADSITTRYLEINLTGPITKRQIFILFKLLNLLNNSWLTNVFKFKYFMIIKIKSIICYLRFILFL